MVCLPQLDKIAPIDPQLQIAPSSLGPDRKGHYEDNEKNSAQSLSPGLLRSEDGEKEFSLALADAEGVVRPADALAGLSSSHIFQDEAIAAHWRQVYEKSSYESRHRFDPFFVWGPEEEKRLLRKVDLRVMCWSWLMFMSLDLIRKNIIRALADNFLADLKLSLNDFNNGQLVFILCFLAAELPSGLISKKVGADKFVPTQIIAWAIVSASQAALKGRTGFMITRALLGLTMGGFLPDQLLYLSYFYTSKELNTRLSWFYTVLGVSQVIGSLLASGFHELRGLHGQAGWTYLFAFEGLMAGVIGILAFFLMPASPTNTKGKLGGKNGWFTEREEKIIVNKVLRDDPSKGDMNNRQGVNFTELWRALNEKDLWPIYLLGVVVFIPWQPPSTIISYILKSLKYSTLEANLLAIPGQLFFAINNVIITWVSVRTDERGIVASFANIWTLPFLVVLYCLPTVVTVHYAWVRFAIITCITAVPYCHPILIGWISQNSHSVRNRAVALCLYNMSVQVSSILATRIYTTKDQPFYNVGNRALIGLAAWSIVQCWLTKLYYMWRNRQKQRIWNTMTPKEQTHYITTTEDQGTQRLDVRFVH
ncbi:hypothetical protein ACQY0O_004486 [Thecaphora frezii]